MTTFKQISSTANETVKAVTALHQTKYRREQQQFIAEGVRIIHTLLEAGTLLDQLYVADVSLYEHVKEFVDDQKVTVVSATVMNKMSAATSPSGLLAVFHIPQPKDIKQLDDGLVLADIADPGNMGTLMRTAAAMGRSSIVVVGGVDPWSPKVVQASAGTIGRLKLYALSWEELIESAKQQKMTLIALVVNDGKQPEKLSFANSLIVVGNEAHGLPESWIADCAEKMTIPMPGHVESLNAAVAGSIALYLAYEHGTR